MMLATHKVLFVMPDLGGGGAERVVITLANALHRKGHGVHIVLFHDYIAYRGLLDPEIRVRAILTDGKPVGSRVVRVLRDIIAEARQCDVVIGGMEGWPTFMGWLAARLTGKHTASWVHTNLVYFSAKWPSLLRRLFRWPYKNADAIVCVSEGVSNSLVKFTANTGINVSVIHNPLPSFAGSPPARVATLKPMILAVGRLLNEQKGFDLLIRAHAYLIKHGAPHMLVILGEGPDRHQLELLIAQENLGDSVHLPGFVQNVAQWYQKADIFVLPSRYEGFSMVLLEAMSHTLPVIAANCPYGPAEILENGKYGDLVTADDFEALARGLLRLIVDPDYRSESAHRAQRRAQDFHQDIILPQWEDLFDKVIGRSSSHCRLPLAEANRNSAEF